MTLNQNVFYNKTINKKELKSIIQSTFQSYGIVTTTHLSEALKKSGFAFATQAGISISIEDLKVPPTKDSLFDKNNTDIKLAYYYEKRGNTNEIERFQKVIDTWHTTSEILKDQLVDYFKTIDPLNPVYMMAFSGARGNLSQVRQLVGMRGLMADPDGQIIDLPIKTNFREGLTITDYVISSYGARKGIVDTALRTADSGYLTRRLVDVAQHVIIRELDCQTKNGVRLSFDPKYNKIEQYLGRVLSVPVKNKNDHKILLERNTVLSKEHLDSIKSQTDLILRSPLICESSRSICQKCYGWNLSQGQLVELADAVGVIAAQSIGEPGTQLTMRTFHTGGVFTGESNTQIRSVSDGQILFSSTLKSTISRTLHGEIILKANNISEFFILNSEKKVLKRCLVTPDMLIFVPNKGLIKNGDLLAESTLLNKRTTTRVKNIFSESSGEIQFQNIPATQQQKVLNNGLIWIASGHIYDIVKNMLIKLPKTKVVKNGAFAQTKITTRVGGMVKCRKQTPLVPYLILNCSLCSTNNVFYKTNDGSLCLTGTKNEIFQLASDIETNSSIFATRITQKYNVSQSQILHYSRVNVAKSSELEGVNIFITQPDNSRVRLSKLSPTSQTYIIENEFDPTAFDNQILYPGEIINGDIEVKVLSYCQISSFNKKSLSLTLTPLQQWVIPKSNQYLDTHKQWRERINIVRTNKELIPINEPFVETLLEFTNTVSGTKNQRIVKLFKPSQAQHYQCAIFQILKLPKILAGIDTEQLTLSYLSKHNQYVHPYSIIGTVNCIAPKKLVIRNLKNSIEKPHRFLLVTNSNYKQYINHNTKVGSDSKFLVVGDKVGKCEVTNYSGYKIPAIDDKKLKIRKSSPFFVSVGTRLFVGHGHLIKQNESLLQFVYTRVISSDIVTGLPRIEQLLESRIAKNACQLVTRPCVFKKKGNNTVTVLEKCEVRTYAVNDNFTNFLGKGSLLDVAQPLDNGLVDPHEVLSIYFKYYCSLYAFEHAAKRSVLNIQILLVNLVQDVYKSQGIYISNKHVEVIVRQITSKVKISELKTDTTFEIGEFLDVEQVRYINKALQSTRKPLIEYQPVLLGITKVSLMTESFISSASFQETTRVLTKAAIEGKIEWLRGLKENVILGRLVPAGTGFKSFNSVSLLNVCLN